MAIETDVQRAIVGAVISAIGSSYPIKAPGRVFTGAAPYIELHVINDNNGNETWGNEQLFSGDIRVILHWPIDDSGVYSQLDALANIKAQFPKGRRIRYGAAANLLISDTPRIIDRIEGGADILFPLIVPFQYYHIP